ncbi:MAG: hypothetical protein VYA30_05075 [Myxococcota bacterium]|nr:hypothetical protein [Myxococcota bacterium]
MSEYVAKNDRLREELNALRADVQALQTQFEATQKALSKFSGLAGAADHNPDIPGLQTEDEIKGIPVLGDPTNTIDPNTPEDQLAEEQRTKEQASRLLAQSREAEERPGPSTEKGAVKESQ